MRTRVQYTVSDPDTFKQRLLCWAQQFDEVVWLDSNGHKDRFSNLESVLAVDAASMITHGSTDAFNTLAHYVDQTKDWIFGYLSYDLKNDLESLASENDDHLFFPDLQFFQPKKIIRLRNNQVEFLYLDAFQNDIPTDFEVIQASIMPQEDDISVLHGIRMRIFKDEYFRQVEKLLDHIHRGDVYEINFCQEFYAEDAVINPLQVFSRINQISRTPFAAFVKSEQRYALCASPERFLRKENQLVISQPMKGTAKRDRDLIIDQALKDELAADIKERAENIMIVDLVRNDLSKCAIKGSVVVDELCNVYTYEQVHQMVSTVKSTVPSSLHPVDIIKDCFPMGSMTGAPKISAMKLIEKYESIKRSVYSGAIGYFTPQGDFDFNVVIRSILYNKANKYLSFSVGSAITAKASPEKEYQECLLKAKAMRSVLESNESRRLATTS